MARSRLEKQFSEQLQSREIKPTAGSWEQLNDKLDASHKKENKTYWWLGIAASVLGGILILSLVFNTTSVEDSHKIVNTPSEEVIESKTNEIVSEKHAIADEEMEVTQTPEVIVAQKEKVPDVQKQPLKDIPVLAENDTENIEIETQTESEINSLPGFKEEAISKKLEEVIAEISALESVPGDATDEEIEQLLYKAAVEISLEENSRQISETINPGDLLFEVEMEIEQSFREKVFEILKDGYTKAKTAVANRNFQ